ncbi:hypothetical protein [Streptomyces sp. NPDC059783]|uniref:hypothetical protein n=1 Tax=Streptomyces sp. NPDC059783 TaxID=3346944 RepID=UPI003654525B
MQPYVPPRIPANHLRPARFWYAVAAVIAVALTAVGAVIGASWLTGTMNAVDTDHAFTNGRTVSLRLDPDHDKSIWIKDGSPGGEQKCSITGPGDPSLGKPGIDAFVTSDATWNPLFAITVRQTGTYEVTCSSDGYSHYAIGASGAITASTGELALALTLPVLGISIGAAVVIIVAVRRSTARKRLLAEHHGFGGRTPVPYATAPAPAGDERPNTV